MSPSCRPSRPARNSRPEKTARPMTWPGFPNLLPNALNQFLRSRLLPIDGPAHCKSVTSIHHQTAALLPLGLGCRCPRVLTKPCLAPSNCHNRADRCRQKHWCCIRFRTFTITGRECRFAPQRRRVLPAASVAAGRRDVAAHPASSAATPNRKHQGRFCAGAEATGTGAAKRTSRSAQSCAECSCNAAGHPGAAPNTRRATDGQGRETLFSAGSCRSAQP